jgi:hypothetical protein
MEQNFYIKKIAAHPFLCLICFDSLRSACTSLIGVHPRADFASGVPAVIATTTLIRFDSFSFLIRIESR